MWLEGKGLVQVVLGRGLREYDVRAVAAQKVGELEAFVEAEQPSALILNRDDQDLEQGRAPGEKPFLLQGLLDAFLC